MELIEKNMVIMTPLHRIGETKIPEQKETGDFGILKDYANIIREVAEYYSLPVLNLFATSGLQPEIKQFRRTIFLMDCIQKIMEMQ